MKKKMIRFFASAAASGALGLTLSAGVMPGIAFADETMVQEGVEETYKLTAETFFRDENRIVLPEEYAKKGQVIVDKTEAKAGETVTVKAVSGTEAGFLSRFNIKRTSDGTDVTEALLGERQKHDLSAETFVMPEYDITVSADTALNAVFEEADTHTISIEKSYEDITAEIDKTSAGTGEKLHLKVDTSTSETGPDLNCIIIKNATTGEEIKRIDGFVGHDHAWEGDIVIPDHDIVIEIASSKWAPVLPYINYYNLIQTEGGKISINKEFGLKDEKMTLSYKADDGYSFLGWIVKDAEGNDITEEVNIKDDGTFDGIKGRDSNPADYYISAVFSKGWASWLQTYSVDINVKFSDSDGKDLTKEVSYKVDSEAYEGEKESLFEDFRFYPEKSMITQNYAVFLGGSSPDMIKSHLKIESVPEGYKLPGEITLTSELYKNETYMTKLTSSDESVTVNKSKDTKYEYEVIVTLEKEDSVAGRKDSSSNVTSKPSPVSSGAAVSRAVSGTTTAPGTGDENNSAVWMAAGIAAAAAGTLGAVKLRKMKRED